MGYEQSGLQADRRAGFRFRFRAAVLAVGGMVILTGCSGSQTDPLPYSGGDGVDPLAVATTSARQETSLREVRNYIGSIKPNRQADLGFPLAGQVATIEVREGDQVQEGQLLATLDVRRLQAKRDRLADARASAQSRLEELDPDAEAMTVEQRRARIEQLRQELAALEQELAAVPPPGDPATAGSQRLSNLETQVRLMNEARRQEQIEGLQEQVSELDGELADVDLELEGGRLTAPFDGVIEIRLTTEGSVVAAGTPVVRISETTRVAWVGIPVPVASRLTIGQDVWLTAGGMELQGTTFAKLPRVDASTRTRTVLIELDSDQSTAGLVAGDAVNIQFYVANPKTGFWLPLAALHREFEGLWSVLVAEPEGEGFVAERRYVEIERLESQRALVSGSLESGEEVIVEGGHRVVPGQRVTPQRVPVSVPPGGDIGDREGPSLEGGGNVSGSDSARGNGIE